MTADSGTTKGLNPLFRKMADATCATGLADRPEWADIARKYEGATLVDIDSAVISYELSKDGTYRGCAGILIETPATETAPVAGVVLAAKVFGRVDNDQVRIEKFVIDLDTQDRNRPAFYRLNTLAV